LTIATFCIYGNARVIRRNARAWQRQKLAVGHVRVSIEAQAVHVICVDAQEARMRA